MEQRQCILVSTERSKQKLPRRRKINPGIAADAKSMPPKETTDETSKPSKHDRRNVEVTRRKQGGRLCLPWNELDTLIKRDAKMVTVDSELKSFKCRIHSNPIVQQTSTSPSERYPSSTPPRCGVRRFFSPPFTSLGMDSMFRRPCNGNIRFCIGCHDLDDSSVAPDSTIRRLDDYDSYFYFFPWPF